MIRRLGFGLVFVTAFIIAACGRQVTPNPPGLGPGGAAPGYMSVRFDIGAPFNFSSYQYWIVFNVSGNGLTPDTQPFQSNWAAYSGAIEIAGVNGATAAYPIQFVKNPSQPHATPHFQYLPTTPQNFQYNLNSNGAGTEVTVIFQRAIFTHPINSPAPSPTPVSNTWLFNAFTTQANSQAQLVFVDSMGAGGPGVPQYSSPSLNITQCFDNLLYALSSGLQIDPPAQIVSVELANNPTNGGCGESPSSRVRR